ncbi:Dihydromonacolin L monooxygenase LovA [Diaporthe amygdali]|uniref:Dihydromonacolin L monooxygenase LovA n=1 Tax=Phomopsis amygdali TaxID=1214568 RepID=UPI0022FE1AD7|nr:Dihydromonacolin L monooxygenase LovA [Diaporthe amygdali]KAJ0115188.1 Dihydromonacolin L monooxygenase LovA [Diaporthe amygdali]
MSSSSGFQVGAGMVTIPTPSKQPLLYVTTVLMLVLVLHLMGKEKGYGLPVINPKKPFELSNRRSLLEWGFHCKDLLAKGRAMFPGKPYAMIVPEGEVMVWPTSAIDEVKSEHGLDFVGISPEDSHGYIPGFEPFAQPTLPTVVINKFLNKAIAKLTLTISHEATRALNETLPPCSDWVEISPADYILTVIARVSTMVFMGEEMAHNKAWIEASSRYAPLAFATSDHLGTYPFWLRRYIHWFLPGCQKVRAQLAECRRHLQPIIDKRRALKAVAAAKGQPEPDLDDSIEWFRKVLKRDDFDVCALQISLSMAAIHTTSDLMQCTMIEIARHPKLFEELREEILNTLRTHGLKKTALYEMKLMDSVIKETQRLKPLLLSTMRRVATKDVKLPSGFVIRKGQKLIVDNTHMWDAAYHENPDQFDPYRFLRLRQEPGKENLAQLAAASVEHMGFGYGLHACPGRFFAANEIKIVLCHVLLKYDWKLAEGCDPKPFTFGYAVIGDPTTKFLIKQRQPELDLDTLEA